MLLKIYGFKIMYDSHFNGFISRIGFIYELYLDFTQSLDLFDTISTPVVTVFCSGMVEKNNKYYDMAFDLGKMIANKGWGVLTGGGKGLMEAVNLGAIKNDGLSYSCRISIKNEVHSRCYTLDKIVKSFWMRKLFLIRPASAFVVLPGGFGTLDEIFEVLTLIRTHKMRSKKIIFIDQKFWFHLRQFIEQVLLSNKMIDACDLDNIYWVDTVEEAVDLL